MNAYKEWQLGNLTAAEYNSICEREAYEYAQMVARKYSEAEPEEWEDFEDDEIDEY